MEDEENVNSGLFQQPKIKLEAMDSDEVDNNILREDEERLAALGLQRVGTTPTPKAKHKPVTPQLNARGMPARIRKKNKMFYDDELVNTPHHRTSSRKSKTPLTNRKGKFTKSPRQKLDSPPPNRGVIDSGIGQEIGLRLRNLLKLPKAHKWVCYEWFYSNIDRCLFSGDNDFTICLKESFPELKTRQLTRIEWTQIRRMMGRPRRCSPAFFNQERLELERKRNKIRALQQRKATDLSSFQDLPPEVPMQLVIGTKVTARLRKPQDGLFRGSIDAVDTSNNTYRITFERNGLGTHSVPDYDVLSNEPPETMNIVNFQQKPRPRLITPFLSPMKSSPLNKLSSKQDPLLSSAVVQKPTMSIPASGTCDTGVSPSHTTKLFEQMIVTSKILNCKRGKIRVLKTLNAIAETHQSAGANLPVDYERRYAGLLIDLEKINKDLERQLESMQLECHSIAPEPSMAAMLVPSLLREKCFEHASDTVRRNNLSVERQRMIINPSILELITELTALMLQIKSLSDSDQNAYELKILDGTIEQIRSKLTPKCRLSFVNSVDVHMKHIKVCLSRGMKAVHKSSL